MMIRVTVARRDLSKKEIEQAQKSAYKNTKHKFYLNIEEYVDDMVWNVITVLESESGLVCRNRAQEMALMFNCPWEVLYE